MNQRKKERNKKIKIYMKRVEDTLTKEKRFRYARFVRDRLAKKHQILPINYRKGKIIKDR